MNDTITDIFNLSISIGHIMDAHKCNEKGCKGPNYGGLNITCGMCLFPSYFDCLATRNEFKHLLDNMQIEPIEENDQKEINEAHIKVKSLFGVDSIFEFICPSCKSTHFNNATLFDMKESMNKSEKKIDELKSECEKVTKEMKTLKTTHTKKMNEMNEVKAKLYDMTNETGQTQRTNVNKNSIELELATLRSQINQKKNEMETFADDLKTILTIQQSRLETFKAESDNAIKSSVDLLNKISSCTSNNEDTGEENDDRASVFTSSQAHQDTHLDPGFHGENSRQKPAKKSHPFNKPSTGQQNTQQSKTKSDDRTVLYEIHISPFELCIESEHIIQHILASIKGISAKSFSVQRLGGNGLQRSSRSFKVSTFESDVYGSILSNDLWFPNQVARPFKNAQPRRGRGHENNDNRPANLKFRNPFAQENNNYVNNTLRDEVKSNYHHDSNNNGPYIPRFDQQRKQNYDNYSQNRSQPNQPHQQQQQQQQYQNHGQQENRNFLEPERGYDRRRRNSTHSNRSNPFRSQRQQQQV